MVCAGTEGGDDGKSWKYEACKIAREVVRSFSGRVLGVGPSCGPLGRGGIFWIFTGSVLPLPPSIVVGGR
jgi:hypothetical protein